MFVSLSLGYLQRSGICTSHVLHPVRVMTRLVAAYTTYIMLEQADLTCMLLLQIVRQQKLLTVLTKLLTHLNPAMSHKHQDSQDSSLSGWPSIYLKAQLVVTSGKLALS